MLGKAEKKRTAALVLRYRVHVSRGDLPDVVYTTRETAEEQCLLYRDRGTDAVVQPVCAPLPVNPWLCVDDEVHS